MMEIHPYRGINDTYLIRLNAIIGEGVKAIPQILLIGDADKYLDNYVAQYPSVQNMGTMLHNLLLATSGLAGEGWYGGVTPELASTSFEAIFLPIEGGTSTSFRPDITPNKKYYYTFRSVDIHGNISFPSKIYEVELVDDSGAIYLVTSIYEFPEPKKVTKKDVRKFMNIIPSSTQTVFESPQDGSFINFKPAMGPLFEGAERYKFRLTSKKSGKKLDINVKVKLTKRKTEEEKTS